MVDGSTRMANNLLYIEHSALSGPPLISFGLMGHHDRDTEATPTLSLPFSPSDHVPYRRDHERRRMEKMVREADVDKPIETITNRVDRECVPREAHNTTTEWWCYKDVV